MKEPTSIGVQTGSGGRVPDDSNGRASGVEVGAATRRLYLDNLKVLLIGGIIAGHGLASYAALELWSYTGVREVTLSPVTEGILFSLLAPFGLFMIPLLFLVAGLLTPPSVERKGPGRFARDRLVRLGIPFVLFVGLIWPLLLYALYRPLGYAPGSYWSEFVGTAEESLDTGYFWFVGDLLIFSLGYAGWIRLRRHWPRRSSGDEVGFERLVLLTGVVAMATFLIRLWFPVESERYVDLNLYEWPAAVVLFGLGVRVARNGWLVAVPAGVYSRCRTMSLFAVGAFGLFIAAEFVLGGVNQQRWSGGWHWEALVFAGLESLVAVFGSVWMLAVAQRTLNRGFPWGSPAISRSAYGAFMVQGPMLIGLAALLRLVPLPAEAKAVLVATGGVAGSFTIAWLLIRRFPGVGRIL